MALRGVPGIRRLADVTSAETSSRMLDPGEARLVALAGRLPGRVAVAARAGLPLPPAGREELLARVARHRGVDFASLAEASRRLYAVAEGVRRRHVALAEEAGTLWESWAGGDADDVADGVGDLARAAHGVVATLEEAAARLEGTAVAVADAVAGLAAALDELPLPADDAGERAGEWTGDTGPTGDVATLRARATAVDVPLHRLLAVLDRTDEAVDRAWADLAAARPLGPPASGADEDPAGVDALLAGLLGPVAVTRERGGPAGPAGPGEVRPRR